MQISINTEAAARIHRKALEQIDQAATLMNELVANIETLFTEGEWKGTAADKFLGEHEQLKPILTTKAIEALNMEAENLKKNLENLIAADSAGAGQ